MKSGAKLSEIQRKISAAIKHREAAATTHHLIRARDTVAAERRLEVYRNAYKIRMIESLRDDYSNVEKVMGDKLFSKMATQYLEECPSEYASLAEFSLRFPEYLRSFSKIHYYKAIHDWLEIQTSYARAIDPARILSAEEVRQGVPFRLTKNPTLHLFSDGQYNVISYRSSDEVVLRRLDQNEVRLAKLIDQPIDMPTLSAQLEGDQENSKLIPLVSDWLAEQIIYCERINL